MKYRLMRIAPSSSVAPRTSARSSQALLRADSRVKALAEEQDVDDDVVPASVRKLPSGRRIAPTRSAVAAMCIACARIRLVHRAGRGDERGESARLQALESSFAMK